MRRTLEELCEGYRFVFAMPLELFIQGQFRPWSDRYIFSAFNASQRLSTLFNGFQHQRY
jgi:hypothetical protein